MSGLVYPQLTQLPMVKRLRRRTVVNRTADGRAIKLGDPAGAITEWELRYTELTDAEAATLRAFFESAEGTLQPFTFVDPTANLLAGTTDLAGGEWTRDPMINAFGSAEEWRLENEGGAAQSIWQDINGPTGMVYCFSLFARADAPTPLTLIAGSTRGARTASMEWRRMQLAGYTNSTRFGIELGAGEWVKVKGLQVEAQRSPSKARKGTRGIFEGAHFAEDSLEVVATGPNRHACAVKIVHVIHI